MFGVHYVITTIIALAYMNFCHTEGYIDTLWN